MFPKEVTSVDYSILLTQTSRRLPSLSSSLVYIIVTTVRYLIALRLIIKKNPVPTPKCSLIVLPKVFRTTATIFGLASDEVPQGYQEQKAIHFCLTCDVEPEQ